MWITYECSIGGSASFSEDPVQDCYTDVTKTSNALAACYTDIVNKDWDALSTDGNTFYQNFTRVYQDC